MNLIYYAIAAIVAGLTVFGVYTLEDKTLEQQIGAFGDAFLSRQVATSPQNGYILQTDGTNSSWVSAASVISGASNWQLTTNTFGQSALAPTTTQNILVSGTGTSTFSGGIEAWRQIGAPYFQATSTSLTSVFPRFSATSGTTTNATSTNLAITSLTSALVQTNANGLTAEYAGTSCTNQFVRSLSALGIATCETVQNTDLANSSVSYGGVSVSLGGSDATPAFNLADATGLPLTTGVTGTLPVGNGGTGSTSFTAGSVVFSNGSILTQDNSNFFWDDASNELGIGTTTPQAQLSSDGDLLIWDGVTNPGLFVDASTGKLAIGTRTVAEANNELNIISKNTNFATVSLRNQVTGTAAAQGTDFYTGSEYFNIYNWDEDGGARIYVSNGDLSFEALANGDVNLASSLATFTDAGRFGLGDTTPDYKAEIVGSAGSGFFGITNSTDGDIFEIDSSGNVGIGTNTPDAKLHIQTGTDVNLEIGDDGSGISRFLSINDARSAYKELRFFGTPVTFYGNGVENMRVASNGRVGIATTTPTSQLDVVHASSYISADAALSLRAASSPNRALYAGYDNTLNRGFIQAIDAGVSFTSLLLNPNGGNIGIGTTTPDAKLTVLSTGTQQKLSYSASVSSTLSTDSNGYLVLDASGNRVGIGGTPVRALSIHDDVPFMEFRDTNQASSHLITSVVEFVSSSATRAGFFGINSQAFQIQTDDRATDIPISFLTVGTERMRIGTDGNIGIATTTASTKLVVHGASPQIGVYDTDTSQFRKVTGALEKSFTYATTTAWTATTTLPLGPAWAAQTWSGAKCFTDVGTLNVSLYDGTNRANLFNASTTVGTISLTTNNTFTASEKRYVDIGTPASSPTKISCTFRYYES